MKAYPASKFASGIPFKRFREVGNWILVDDGEPRVAPSKPQAAPRKSAKPEFDAGERAALRKIDAAIARGLGDDVAAVAHAIGADKAAALWEKVSGKSCGCSKRRKWLNEFWPYKQRRGALFELVYAAARKVGLDSLLGNGNDKQG